MPSNPSAPTHDHLARRLAGERGREIAQRLPTGPLSWSLAIRTKVFDELIVEAVEERDVRVVVNLAAGLDARPFRLAVPPNLEWIEVDLPQLIRWKNDALANEVPRCAVERVPLDLANAAERRALFARLGATKSKVLVVSEGFLAYLDETTVGELAGELRESFPGALWALENVSPPVLDRMKRTWGAALGQANAQMKFAPPDGLAFFQRRGWVPRVQKSLLDEAERLGREMPVVRAIRFFSRFIPPLGTAYAKRQAKFRDAVAYALMG